LIVCSPFTALCLPRRSGSTLFPYTTLFRSRIDGHSRLFHFIKLFAFSIIYGGIWPIYSLHSTYSSFRVCVGAHFPFVSDEAKKRSEEHTSELQSRFDLVCRLLLDKKKKDT